MKDIKRHDTIVIGWDNKGRAEFVKTFDFGMDNTTEREEALAALDYVEKHFARWVIGDPLTILHADKFKKEEFQEEEE